MRLPAPSSAASATVAAVSLGRRASQATPTLTDTERDIVRESIAFWQDETPERQTPLRATLAHAVVDVVGQAKAQGHIIRTSRVRTGGVVQGAIGHVVVLRSSRRRVRGRQPLAQSTERQPFRLPHLMRSEERVARYYREPDLAAHRVCATCGASLRLQRADSVFCSARCRMRLKRRAA